MKSRFTGEHWTVMCLVVLALLFAPNIHEGPTNAATGSPGPIEVRVLTPTIGEAIGAPSPRLTTPHRLPGDQSWTGGSIPLAVASAAVAVLLLWTALAALSPSGKRPHLLTLRSLVPRGPPGLHSA